MKENDKCINCGNELEWGKFAYDQKMCIHCFRRRVTEIANSMKPDNRDMIKWMLAAIMEINGHKM